MPEDESSQPEHEVKHRAEAPPDAEPARDDPDDPDEPDQHGRHEAAPDEGEDAADAQEQVAESAAADTPAQPAATLVAEGIGVRSPSGWIFRDVDLVAQPGEVVAVVGPSGSGRSTLLLALAARLQVEGTLQVAGEEVSDRRAPRSVLRRVAVARAADAIGPDPLLSVARNARDAADWAARPATEAFDLLASWRARTGLPFPGDRPLQDTAPLEQLTVCLVLALVAEPLVVLIDDLDAGLTESEREQAWEIVRAVASSGPSVVVTSLDPPARADHLIRLGDDTMRPDVVGSQVPEPDTETSSENEQETKA